MIYIFSPKYTQCYFIQVMKALSYELNELDYKCEIISDLNIKYIESNKDNNEELNKNIIIIFGFHDICSNNNVLNYIKNFKTIVYNSEQLHVRSWSKYLNSLTNIDYIWDYSINNIKLLNDNGINNTTHVPLGYSDGFLIKNINEIRKNDKIIFIGTGNGRRYKIFEKINNLGEPLEFHTNTWGNKYDECVKNNNLFINIHYYPNPILELFRIVPLLCNGCSVLSEYSYDKNLDIMYEKYVGFIEDDMSNLSSVKIDLLERREQICSDFKNNLKFADIIKKSGILEHLR